MKMVSAALVFSSIALIAPVASAHDINVVSLADLDEWSQLAQFQEEDGRCRFYGSIGTVGYVQIEVKTCPTKDGSLIETPLSATVQLDIPVRAGTRLHLNKQ